MIQEQERDSNIHRFLSGEERKRLEAIRSKVIRAEYGFIKTATLQNSLILQTRRLAHLLIIVAPLIVLLISQNFSYPEKYNRPYPTPNAITVPRYLVDLTPTPTPESLLR